VGQRLRADGVEAELLEVRDLPAGPLLAGDAHHPAIAAAVERLTSAGAVVVGTPIYKAAYTGLLKAFLDLLPQYALRGTSVLPLATGGTPAHVLALDYALRPVLTSLGADHVAQGWFVLDKAVTRSEVGAALTEEVEALLWPVVDSFTDRLLSDLAVRI
ncbi:MAG: putative NAD(P)H-dependent reductase, partial [Frankiales bacterium]|nr:putative NAD(P)H-dependent reductase [Frankiales bacterium]